MSNNSNRSEQEELDNFIDLYNQKKFETILKSIEFFIKKFPNNFHAKNIFALTLKSQGRFEESKKIFLEVINNNLRNPKIAYIYTNTGNLYYDLGQVDQAITFHKASIQLDPKSINSYLGLGLGFSNQGDNEKAVQAFNRGLEIDKNNQNLLYNLATSLRKLERYKEAADCYSKTINPLSKSYQLDCLYLDLENDTSYEEFNHFLNKINLENNYNPLIASINTHSSIRFEKENKCNFCKKPFDFIKKEKLFENERFNEDLINKVLKDFESSNISRKTQSLLNKGFQSSGNIFNLESKAIQELKKIIEVKISDYRKFYQDSNEGFIKNWPKNYTIYGWLIIMNEGGNLSSHIHKEGWLSSSIYLKRPTKIKKNDGDIKFSLHGGNYESDKKEFPEKIINIDQGDMVMFPSSIFHSTIPFDLNEQRITLAFDILPK